MDRGWWARVGVAAPGREGDVDMVVNVKGENDGDDNEDDNYDDDEELAKQGSEADHFGSGRDPGFARASPGTLVAEKSPWWLKRCENQNMFKRKIWQQAKAYHRPNLCHKRSGRLGSEAL